MRSGLPRGVDVLVAAGGLLLASPVIALCAAAVAATSGWPVFYRQERVGRFGKPFTLVKLRTLRPSVGPAVTAEDDARITRVGRLLRRSKLDELPQLWNVLKGDMALVGPRPEVARYVQFEQPLWREVLLTLPGLTDPVTLQLRNEEALLAGVEGDRDRYYRETLLPWKLRGYREFLAMRSWRGDLGVIWDTLVAILRPATPEAPPDLSDRPPGA